MKIAIIGTFQVGKSTLVNCLVKDDVAGVGIGMPTTHTLNYYRNSSPPCILYRDKNGRCVGQSSWDECQRITEVPTGTVRIMYDLPKERNDLQGNVIIDTPGLDASGEDASWDTMCTSDIINDATVELLILVVPNSQLDYSIKNKVLPFLKKTHKRLVVLMNCNRNNPDPNSEQNRKMARQIDEELKQAGIIHDSVWMKNTRVLPCNVVWWWISLCAETNGSSPNQQDGMVLQERRQQVRNYFTIILGQAVPDAKELREKSNLSYFLSFLNDYELRRELWKKDNPPISRAQIRSQLALKIQKETMDEKEVFQDERKTVVKNNADAEDAIKDILKEDFADLADVFRSFL